MAGKKAREASKPVHRVKLVLVCLQAPEGNRSERSILKNKVKSARGYAPSK